MPIRVKLPDGTTKTAEGITADMTVLALKRKARLPRFFTARLTRGAATRVDGR